MQTLPTTNAAIADLIREILPPFADVTTEPEGVRVVANSDNRGMWLYIDDSDPSDVGMAYRFGDDSGPVRDSEDLGWALCDVLGIKRPKLNELWALAREAGAHGDEAQVKLCRLAQDGDPAAIVACAQVMAYAADRTDNG